jgi:hypothetical protein
MMSRNNFKRRGAVAFLLIIVAALSSTYVHLQPAAKAEALVAGDADAGAAKWLWLALAFPSSAASALLQWREQWLPNTARMPPDTFPQIRENWANFQAKPSLETLSEIPHSLNNLTTELVRADSEYWSKMLLFVIALQLILILRYRWRLRRQG